MSGLSPNPLAILGVIAHYIAEEGEVKRSLLAMWDIIGSHEGTNLAHILWRLYGTGG
jgi:hypothetical protein